MKWGLDDEQAPLLSNSQMVIWKCSHSPMLSPQTMASSPLLAPVPVSPWFQPMSLSKIGQRWLPGWLSPGPGKLLSITIRLLLRKAEGSGDVWHFLKGTVCFSKQEGGFV